MYASSSASSIGPDAGASSLALAAGGIAALSFFSFRRAWREASKEPLGFAVGLAAFGIADHGAHANHGALSEGGDHNGT